MVEYCCEPKEDVRFLVLDDGGFVVAISKDQQEVRIGSEPFDGRVNDGVKVSPVVMLWTNVVLAPARVALALHQTKKVTIDDDSCVAALCLFEVVGQQPPIAMRVVPMQIRYQKDAPFLEIAFDFDNRFLFHDNLVKEVGQKLAQYTGNLCDQHHFWIVTELR